MLNPYCGGPYKKGEEVKVFKCAGDYKRKWVDVDEMLTAYDGCGASFRFNTYFDHGRAKQLMPTFNGFKDSIAKYPSRSIYAGDRGMNAYNQKFLTLGKVIEYKDARSHNKKKPYANIVFMDSHVDYILMEPEITTETYTFLPSSNYAESWIRNPKFPPNYDKAPY